MKHALAWTTCAVALTLGACGIEPPAGATSVCRLMAREIAAARGATPRDQVKIDAAVEAAIRAACVTRREVIGG